MLKRYLSDMPIYCRKNACGTSFEELSCATLVSRPVDRTDGQLEGKEKQLHKLKDVVLAITIGSEKIDRRWERRIPPNQLCFKVLLHNEHSITNVVEDSPLQSVSAQITEESLLLHPELVVTVFEYFTRESQMKCAVRPDNPPKDGTILSVARVDACKGRVTRLLADN